MANGGKVVELDPYRCIPKRNQKYASECTEVYLSDLGGATVSEYFKRFPNVEVIWFNGNRLSRIENLEENFRIKEVYVQDNMLVSLSGIRTFKFLRVLLASNNQIRNLDKQLAFLTRFAFLNKLDLFDNPVAEEPDYRLRLIYNIPQVEILDRHTVKVHERIKADEVVPNLDKVSTSKVEGHKKKHQGMSSLERECFMNARDIKGRRKKEQEESFDQTYSGSIREGQANEMMLSAEEVDLWKTNNIRLTPWKYVDADRGGKNVLTETGPWRMSDFLCKLSKTNSQDSQSRAIHELLELTPWEKSELQPYIVKKAGKDQLTKDECGALIGVFESDPGGYGKDDRVLSVGRVLCDPLALNVNGGPSSKHRGSSRSSRLDRSSTRGSMMGNSKGGDRSSRSLTASSELPDTGPLVFNGKEWVGSDWSKLKEDPTATISTTEFAMWLCSLQWTFKDDSELHARISQLYEEAERSEKSNNDEAALGAVDEALRLKGVLDRKTEAKLSQTNVTTSTRKRRVDVFHQSFLRPSRIVDEQTGRTKVAVSCERNMTSLGG